MTEPAKPNDPGEDERLKQALLGPELEQFRDLVRRFGDDAAHAETLQRVLVQALREAGVRDHEQLAKTLVPLVRDTVAAELPRHRRIIASAMVPEAHRILIRGVGSALHRTADLVERVASPIVWAQRVQALATGQSATSLRLGSRLWLEGDALVHEASSDIITAHASAADADIRSEIARSAASENEPNQSVNTHSTKRRTLWTVRDAGFTWVVATQGGVPADFAQSLHAILKQTLSQWQETIAAAGDMAPGPVLATNIARTLEELCRQKFRVRLGGLKPRPRPWFGYAMLVAAFLGVAAWGAWQGWQAYRIAHVESRAEAALEAKPALARLQLAVRFDPADERLIVRGVVAERDMTKAVEAALSDALPEMAIDVLLIAPPPQPLPQAAPAADSGVSDQVRALYARLNALQAQLSPAVVDAWFASRNIRFADGTTYADPDLAQTMLGNVRQVIRDWPGNFNLRIVGYGDSTGSAASREKAALARASKVMSDLIAAGIPRERLSAVGRSDAKPLSFIHGEGSLNRRVEFEVYTPDPTGG